MEVRCGKNVDKRKDWVSMEHWLPDAMLLLHP